MGELKFMLGYDYALYALNHLKIPICADVGHLVATGSTGSGKSTALLYWLYKMRNLGVNLWVADFKKSGEFSGVTQNFAEFEATYDLICSFYEMFLALPEGGDSRTYILLMEEAAGMLSHYGLSKNGKAQADHLRAIMSSILMLGRSRKCFLYTPRF